MSFFIKTAIGRNGSFRDFLRQRRVGDEDLIIGSECVLENISFGKFLPCDVLYQEICGEGEPDDEAADVMLDGIDRKEAKNGKAYERIVVVGESSTIDMAKLSVFGSGLRCSEIFEKGARLPRRRKLIAVPTTCGTASEVTDTVTVAFGKQRTKREISAASLFPDEAVLIEGLLRALPYETFVAGSIEALSHTMESYVSPEATLFTRTIGESAMERILTGYKKLVEEGSAENGFLPDDVQSFLTASAMAGIAAGGAGVGAVHGLSRPVSAVRGVSSEKAHHLIFEEIFAACRRSNADISPLEAVLGAILNCGRRDVWDNLFGLLARVLPRSI